MKNFSEISFEDVKNDQEVNVYIRKADELLEVLGYTDHSSAHASKVAHTAGKILRELGYSEREVELAKIAGYLHDIGNFVSRHGHSTSGAMIAFNILSRLEVCPEDISIIVSAIGNHDEGLSIVASPITAALIISDKVDVDRERVRNVDPSTFDIHDRVNYAVDNASLTINSEYKVITLDMDIDKSMSSVMNYFEIFLERMLMCKKSANYLDCNFELYINDTQLC